MLPLHPGNSFTVVRQIANHTDTATYYVRAVIRNAYTDAVIDTLDLTSRGSQRFSKNWQVPQDPSGQGFYISIVTSVYTDSGYTTKSENYGDEETTYLVQDRITMRGGGGGGGIDYYLLRQTIREELEKLPKPETVDLSAIPTPEMPQDRTDEVLRAIAAIPKPKAPERTDLTPVLSELASVREAIDAKPVTPETDLTPVLERLSTDREETDGKREEVRQVVQQMDEKLPDLVREIMRQELTGITITGSFKTHEAPKEKQQAGAEKSPLQAINLKDLAK